MTARKSSDEPIAESLLAIIRKKPGVIHPFEKLTRELKTDHASLLGAVKLLADWEYRVKIRAVAGVTFVSAPDQLTAVEIANGLKSRTFGRNIHAFRTVQSTNDVAAAQAEHGAVEGTIVVADQQTKGRGRLGRTWYSPPGTGIYLSIVLRPIFPPEDAPGLSLMTALALAETLEKYCPGGVQIKWPNDVLLGGRKVAGILTELSAEKEKISHVIVGIGINVNHGVGHFPADIKNRATSVRRYLKHKISRIQLLQEFLYKFEHEYALYRKHLLGKAHGRLRKYSSLSGQQVTVRAGDTQRISGEVRDIDIRGRLILESGGRRIPITAGEVTVVK
jgi:BirA family biotin operon repressor/biotin-[acetyl-CoA-carboxylase] ligase